VRDQPLEALGRRGQLLRRRADQLHGGVRLLAEADTCWVAADDSSATVATSDEATAIRRGVAGASIWCETDVVCESPTLARLPDEALPPRIGVAAHTPRRPCRSVPAST
jgi:hypothetical protein